LDQSAICAIADCFLHGLTARRSIHFHHGGNVEE
jgi:hypothetical protein